MVKKSLVIMMVACALNIVSNREAKAGLILIGFGLAPVAASEFIPNKEKAGKLSDASLYMEGGGVASTLISLGLDLAGLHAYYPFLILDADGAIDQDILVEGFSKAYPFIDNSDTLVALATLVKFKVPSSVDQRQIYSVSLSENETRSALGSSELSENQIQRIIRDLK